MQKIDTAKITEGVKTLIETGATLKQLKGVSNAELEAVYSLAFGYYRTGKYDEAAKLFQFLVLFDHLNAKFWFGLGAVQQAMKDYQGAVASYGYCSFLNLENPKPQLHAAECFLALGDKRNAASSLEALNEYGCMRLGARIYDLRRAGHRIGCTTVRRVNAKGEVKHFAQYSLEGNA